MSIINFFAFADLIYLQSLHIGFRDIINNSISLKHFTYYLSSVGSILELHFILFNLQYRTRAIISRSRFEAALVYKPRILGPTFLVYVLK